MIGGIVIGVGLIAIAGAIVYTAAAYDQAVSNITHPFGL